MTTLWIPRSLLLRGSSMIVVGYTPELPADRDTLDWPAFTADTIRELIPYVEAHHDAIILGPGENTIGDVWEMNQPGLKTYADRFEITTENGKLSVYALCPAHWLEPLEVTL